MRRLALAFVLTSAVGSTTAFAQQSGTLNRFSASETPEDDWHISRPGDLGHLRFGAQLHFDYAHDPLVVEQMLGDRDSESGAIVDHQLNMTLGLSLGIKDRLVIFAGLPVVLVQNGDRAADLMAMGIDVQADGAGMGDVYLGARVRIFGEADDIAALGFQLTGTFPTAGSQRLRGDEFLSLAPELLFELRPGPARITFNVGARIRENASDSTNLAFRDELTFGLGFGVVVFEDDDPNTHLDVTAQVYGSTQFEEAFGREETALEATAGLKFFHESGVTAGVAAGPGLSRGFGAPDVRAIGMVGYRTPVDVAPVDTDGDGIMDPDDECVDQPEDVDTFQDTDGCPDPDNDDDGILDTSDECPMIPETVNEFEDADGCPDEVPDTDGDGLKDDVDQCVDQPEDFDQWEDEDGCPDPDNDQDGVLDGADGCPLEAGPIENRGCPDSDRDGDTVVDRRDNCPDEPGPPENHGCREEQQVVIADGRLEILDKVYFRTNRATIQRRSYALLENVATVLNNHPEITYVRVEGHTDSRGRHDYNVRLSQQRAEAVVEFLVERGEVSAERLEARGFGPDRPIVPDASSRAEHAQNRRVEFNLVGDADGVQQQDSGPQADTID